MQRIARIGLVCLVVAVAAGYAAATAAAPAPVAALQFERGSSCQSVAAGQALAGFDLAGLDLAGLDLAPPPPSTAGSPPLCPARISCGSCGEGDGPCFIKAFGSDTCCTSPGGPCFTCPTGTTIYVESCPCFGDGPGLAASCPARDQDWFCG
jgi:hypothetical protein